MILLVCAVERELAFWKPRDDVDVLATGVGPVEAAAVVGRALARKSYDLVIDAGIAGAFDDAAAIGEGVVVSEDCMELDLETGDAIALPGGRRVTDTARSAPQLVERLVSADFAALRGVTVARVTSTEATAARLAAKGAQVESMEGFAVLRAAELAGVPAIELRGISNRVGARERSGWNFSAGVDGLQRIVAAFFE